MGKEKTIEDLEQEVSRRTEEYLKKRTEFISDIEKEQRRARLIEQYVGEMLKPTLKTDGYEKAYIAFPDVDEVVSIAKYAADAVIKATEEK